MQPELDRVEALADEVRRDGITTVYLLGMGGSSLCAEVMRSVYGVRDGFPAARRHGHHRRGGHPRRARARSSRRRRCSSSRARAAAPSSRRRWKSCSGQHMSRGARRRGGTALRRRHRSGHGARAAGGARAATARRSSIRRTSAGASRRCRSSASCPARSSARRCASMLVGRRRHGGRLPAGEPQESRARARRVHRLQRGRGTRQADRRPAAVARSARAVDRTARRREHRQARQGRAPGRRRAARRARRVRQRSRFVAISTDRDAPDAARLDALEAAGHPVLPPDARASTALGAEFFRWEFATAVAGAVLGINPFDEPNVSEAKEKTKAILAKGDFSGGRAGRRPRTACRSSRRASPAPTPAEVVARSDRRRCGPRDYVAFLSYLPADPAIETGGRAASATAIRAQKRTREHLRRRAALPALDRAVPQGRAEHDASRS